MNVCKTCGHPATDNFCSHCGQPLITKRITFHGLMHDILHLFTHIDKGFLFTFKQLLVAPGIMQRTYIEGDRGRHQKPFSMFFICATVAALFRYWVFNFLLTYYDTGNLGEGNFFHEYMVLFHIGLLPIYTLLIFLLFYNSGYNYAEIGVLNLYAISFLFITTMIVSLLKFIWPSLDTAYVELPILLGYNVITFVNFFNKQSKWLVAVKSIICAGLIFFIIQMLEDLIISKIG